VQIALFFDVRFVAHVPPAAFHPPPKVDSTVVLLEPRARAAELGIGDPAGFLAFVARAFHQKRKTLRNNLAGAYPREAVDALPEAGLRAEQLTLEAFASLYRRLAPR
jgi:16S rRNA (adenine1518-N6/adenine1519-N6)-dimethyltransferase